MMRTIPEAAAALGLAVATVRRWCSVLGFERQGRDWLLTDEQVDTIAQHAQDGPGRPRKAGPA